MILPQSAKIMALGMGFKPRSSACRSTQFSKVHFQEADGALAPYRLEP
jgi:hypothetical protein